jgi:acetyl-CoA synthetase
MAYPFQIKSEDEYRKAYQKSIQDPEAFWSEVAQHLYWRKPWHKVLNWDFKNPEIEWFIGGKLNITENCLDRHLETQGDKPALIWEANHPEEEERIFSYKELHFKVMQFANVLKNNGIKKGDFVCIYMGMVPELSIALLACARIGAIHSVVFGGFSAQSIADRLQDAHIKYIITCDGSYRGNKVIPLKNVVDEALTQCDFVEKVIVLSRAKTPVNMIKGRDTWWEDEIQKVEAQGNPDCPAEEMDSEDPLFILYTSGSTGKPKGIIHTCGGYMVYTAYTFVNVFQYQPGDVHFCTADIGWITGHSYIIYGPLAAGATTLQYEGLPSWPKVGRIWEVVDKFKVNILYTAPTAIRSLMSEKELPAENHDLSSLKVLGSVGEPINEAAWHWLDKEVGRGKCPIVDTWWQTETGGIMISNLAGVTPAKPSFATLPLPGIQPVLMDENGHEARAAANENGQIVISGNLCIKFPWPGMLRTTYGDDALFKRTYFSRYEGLYFSGDGCYKDEEGDYRITGRVDDVLNVSGHRIGTAELENAINKHPGVLESAVVGYPHPLKGQGIYAFVIFDPGQLREERSREGILETVSRIIGPIAKPDVIQFVEGLPKTRSGKIMRRILR